MNPIFRVIRHLNHLAEEDRKRHMVLNYNIDPSFQMGRNVYFYGQGAIHCGPGGHIGDNSTIYSAPLTGVCIGKNAAISHNVRMYSGSRTIKGPVRYGNIFIGNDVWIGLNAYIGPSVRIGDGAIIGANCVITRDVPSGTVVKVSMQ